MTPILQLTLTGLQGDMARLDQIAFNLANAQTPAFKREVAIVPSFARQIDAAAGPSLAGPSLAGPSLAGPPLAGPPAGPPLPGAVHVDATPGALRFTGRSLDIALAGPGWLEVATARGLAYTRQGQLQVDAQGRLVTPQGDAVMGTSGEIRLTHPDPVIDAQGRVFDQAPGAAATRRPEDAVAQLKVVQVPTGAPLERLGGGLMRLLVEPERGGTTQPDVRQGHLENANVDAAREMVQLVQTMRHAETLQKVALGYDDMLGSAIRRLGETS